MEAKNGTSTFRDNLALTAKGWTEGRTIDFMPRFQEVASCPLLETGRWALTEDAFLGFVICPVIFSAEAGKLPSLCTGTWENVLGKGVRMEWRALEWMGVSSWGLLLIDAGKDR